MTGIQIQLFRRGSVLLACALITLVGCDSPRPIEATSLLGAPLVRPAIEPAKSARLKASLAEAHALASAAPDSQDAAIWVGRRVGYLGRYLDAIAQYTSAIGHFGETAKLLRHRGHRYITLRQIDRAIVDLTQAKLLAIDRTSLFQCRRRVSRAHGRGKCARNSATLWRMTSFRFYARPHGRATVSLSQAKVIAAVEVLSRAL